jgi:malate dehydrogenase (oxaloacetate-decarboxylating)(NADP+)
VNAIEITGKEIDKLRIVVCGAGAAAISCSRLILQWVQKEKT